MASSRPAVTLRLTTLLRDKIIRSGYTTVGDLCAIPIADFAKELKLTPEQARDLLDQLHPKGSGVKSFTADQTWEQEKKLAPITTSSPAIDSIFGGAHGGIPPGKITEICGLPGSGKTQLGIQLAINAQIPRSMGGAGGSSIYIDTEGSFVARRASQLASACSARLKETSNAAGTKPVLAADDLLRGIQYCRVHSPVEFIAMIRILGSILQEHPKVKLVVVDSISFLFRSNFSDTRMRTKLVASLGRQLADLARQHDLVVVVMNQMTTTIDAPTTGKRAFDPLDDNVHPALGETWGSICTHRIRLYDRGGGQQRHARMFKSPTMQEQTVAFHIGPDGISDVVDPTESGNKVEGGGIRAGEDDDMDFGNTSTQSMLFWDDFS
ncbi:DNA repair protein rad51c [Linnemannia gamsii]|uniref:DNA repair protein RAD51 homolog 3 n=1 Tax=Linnemannia gamsii TaxID=64522 RepID=A0ABQ7K0P7_9FUNG|nr:DNA repair protein rad51c [Linnemannia gamsii]